MSRSGEVAIIGGGLSGSLLANLLGGAGFRVDVFEKRPDPESAAGEAGRSLSLGLSRAGLSVLDHAGIGESIRIRSLSLRGRQFHLEGGGVHFEEYATPPVPGSLLSAQGGARAVTRPDLNRLLREKAESRNGIRYFFGHRLVDLEPESGEIRLETAEESLERRYRIVIGADGAFSRVRTRLAEADGFVLDESTPGVAYKELRIPPGPDGIPRLEHDAVHIWPRHRSVLFAIPCRGGGFAAALFLPTSGQPSFEALDSELAIRELFTSSMPEALSLIPSLEKNLSRAPLGRLHSIRCRPWHQGRVVLVGDACHAMIPFAGQGANSALEDGLELARRLVDHRDDPSRAFAEYTSKRQPITDHLTSFSLAITPLMMNLGALGAALSPGAMHSIESP